MFNFTSKTIQKFQQFNIAELIFHMAWVKKEKKCFFCLDDEKSPSTINLITIDKEESGYKPFLEAADSLLFAAPCCSSCASDKKGRSLAQYQYHIYKNASKKQKAAQITMSQIMLSEPEKRITVLERIESALEEPMGDFDAV